MHSDAGASARVRREHEEGRAGGLQVSFTVLFHLCVCCARWTSGLFGLTWFGGMASHAVLP